MKLSVSVCTCMSCVCDVWMPYTVNGMSGMYVGTCVCVLHGTYI